MSEIEASNDCGVRCPKQLECVRQISRYEVLIANHEKETFAIDMAWRVSEHADEESPIIERLKESTQVEVNTLQQKLQAAQQRLGRLMLSECEGPEIIIDHNKIIKWECMATQTGQESSS